MPACWYRYIDDIFCVWNHGLIPLTAFHNRINSLHPTIKFTLECSHSVIPFLNVNVHNQGGVIQTSWYRKPTKSNIILNFESAHPLYQKVNLIGSQLTAVRRLCSTPDAMSQAELGLRTLFELNSYPTGIIDRQISHARNRSTAAPGRIIDPLAPNPQNSRPPVIVLPYLDSQFKRKFDNILHKSGLNCRVIWRPGPSIKSILVKSALTRHGCSKRVCHACESGFEGNCGVRNCVYQVECKLCGKSYIGQTNRAISVRFTEHYRAAKNLTATSAIGEHFEKEHGLVNFDAIPLSAVFRLTILAHAGSYSDRLYKEAILIRDMSPELNRDGGWWL